MNSKPKLSVVVSAYNEEKKIQDCLDSVNGLADEIIVIDNQSLDGTVAIVKKYTKHIFSRKNNLMLNINKNFGFSKASGDWILNLDADERVSEELKSELLALFANEIASDVSGFALPRKNIIFGKWTQHTGWYPDYHLRLFRKGKGKFAQRHVHEQLEITGKAEKLKNPLIHQHYESVAQFLQKTFFLYAPSEADVLLKNGYIFSYKDALIFPMREFLSRFFAREGYKDGFTGLMLSILMAFYHFVVFANLWEKHRYQDNDLDPVLLLENQKRDWQKDISYWVYTTKISSSVDPWQKLFLRIKKRLLSL